MTALHTSPVSMVRERPLTKVLVNSSDHVNDHPLTPVKTPQSSRFEANVIITPTFDSNFPDPRSLWDTPNTYAFDPQDPSTLRYQLTPGQVPGQRTDFSSPHINGKIAAHVHHLSPNPLGLPPVELARQLCSSPRPTQGGGENHTRSGFAGELPDYMQTPPPTRAANTKSFQQEVQRPATASMADSRRFSTPGSMRPPETPNRAIEASPQLFPTLQFSPDLFQYPMSGPMTAPILPQHRLFWDSNDESAAAFTNPYQDSFNADPVGAAHPFIASPVTSQNIQPSHVGSLQQPFEVQSSPAHFLPTSSPQHINGPAFGASFSASPRIISSRPEDPAMFLSSPARRFGPAPKPATLSNAQIRAEREAYHHQIRESKREQEERLRKTRTKKELAPPPKVLRPKTPPRPDRPGIKRSVTHSGISAKASHDRRQSQMSFSESITDDRGLLHGGRSSPLKRPFEGPLNIERPASRNRVSLSFTIDEDGRAKTIAKPIVENEVDTDSHSSSDSFDDGDFNIAASRDASFAFPTSDVANPQMGLLHPKELSHSKSSSYSSAFGSSGSGNPSSRTSSAVGGTKQTPRRAEDMVFIQRKEAPGDAQQALRAIMRDRQASSRNVHPASDIQTFHSSPPIQQYGYNVNISPTTITDPDLATPSTDRESHASSSTRCICSSSDQVGRFMIQCESCSKWLHMKCVGLDPQAVPAVFVCVYCAQTPMRHGRLRDPAVRANPAGASPLAHKSHRLR